MAFCLRISIYCFRTFKALLEGEDGQSHIFKSIQVSNDGTSILQDMELDEKNGFLYVLQKRALYKVFINTEYLRFL